MASVAKSMTAYLILKHHPLVGHANGPTIHVTAAEAAAFPHQVALQQSLVPVRAGEALTERQALEALMLASADNVAQILARWDAGSVPAFLGRMNATAKALGMTHTHYTDPSGYDAGTRSTVADQIKLADTAMRMASFERVVSTQTAVIPVAGRISNFNALLGQQGVVGIKTGSMSAAGGCLLFAARSTVAGKSVTILGTVLGQRSNRIGDLHQAFASSRTLLTAVHRASRAAPKSSRAPLRKNGLRRSPRQRSFSALMSQACPVRNSRTLFLRKSMRVRGAIYFWPWSR
jgi:D-alanyl-D-alanine carboxypeptidase (penicillin-binding protein 5/6)